MKWYGVKTINLGVSIHFFFKEFFVDDFSFCFIFSDDLRPKSINVWEDC